LTVRRFIPNRDAISRCETPSAANALTSAHSDTLRTLPPPFHALSINKRERPDDTGHHRSDALFTS
jgi:hypothetical protein